MAQMTSGGIFPGFTFHPSDEDLLDFYLRRKTQGLAEGDLYGAIPTMELFGSVDALPPWLVHPAASVSFSCNVVSNGVVPRKVTDWFYCYARTVRRGSGYCRTTSCGTWVTTTGDKPVTAARRSGRGDEQTRILGYRSSLSFKIPGNGGHKWIPTFWVMQEFKLHRGQAGNARKAGPEVQSGDLVLCLIRCTKPWAPGQQIEQPSSLGVPTQRPKQDDESERPQKRLRVTECGDDQSPTETELWGWSEELLGLSPDTCVTVSQIVNSPATPLSVGTTPTTAMSTEGEDSIGDSTQVECPVGLKSPDAICITEDVDMDRFWETLDWEGVI